MKNVFPRETGPKYPTIGLDYGYKSSFSLNHRFNHYDRRIRMAMAGWLAGCLPARPAARPRPGRLVWRS
jgi:hypothetical protein